MAEIFEVLRALDTAYEAGEECVHPATGEEVTDHEYDLLRQQARLRHPADPYWDETTGSRFDVGSVIRLRQPMTSLEKLVGDGREEAYKNWVARCRAELGPRAAFAVAWKRDGVGCALEYVDGELVAGGLRPRNGFDCENRIKNLSQVESIPRILPERITCSVRGELFTQLSRFRLINAALAREGRKTFKNARNYTTGSIRQDLPEETAGRGIQFVAYGITGLASATDHFRTESERASWCREVLGIPHVVITPHNPPDLASLSQMEEKVGSLNFLVDGIVLMVEDLESQEQMGRHGSRETGNPVGKVAWKFADEQAWTRIGGIRRQTGRTGRITPVGNLDPPVELAGTTVSQVTLHNYGYMRDLGITIGTEVLIIKAGAIIPRVKAVGAGAGPYGSTNECPECLHETTLVPGGDGKVSECCLNRKCPAQVIHSLLHYLHTMGVKGLGEATVRILVESGLVKTPADFYDLNVPSLKGAGITERESLLALAGIHLIADQGSSCTNARLAAKITQAMSRKKSIPLSQFLAALGIPGVGDGTGQALVDHFGRFDRIRGASEAELVAAPSVGAVTASSLRKFFQVNSCLIDLLLASVEPGVALVEGPLEGLTFCLSGGFPNGKEFWEREIIRCGGRLAGGVSRKLATSGYLVAGPGSGSKLDRARDLGVQVLDLPGLERLLC